MKINLIALIAGMIFGIGLSLSQMINPNKILDFLDVTGHFDPSLIFVMLGALLVSLISFKWIRGLPSPLWTDTFQLSKKTIIDKPLIIGSMLFGMGWGITGYCPGPAITSLSLLSLEPFIIVISICTGFFAYYLLFERTK